MIWCFHHIFYNAIHWLSFLFHKAALTYHQVSKNVFVSLHLHLLMISTKVSRCRLVALVSMDTDTCPKDWLVSSLIHACFERQSAEHQVPHILYRTQLKNSDVNWVRSPRDALYRKMYSKCVFTLAQFWFENWYLF